MQSDNNYLTKKEIRERLISLRKKLKNKWIEEKSIQIEERLFKEKDFIEKTNILFYDAFEKEVQTERMIKRSLDIHKRAFLPVTDFKNKKILISEVRGKNMPIKIIPEDIVEVVIVPGVAFSKSGCRIGFGMGFYDRFLSRLSKDVKTIGLAFDFQIVNDIPLDNHDVTLDRIITEKRVIVCYKRGVNIHDHKC
ncbi:MAG: 5-formyltetrahydrofolate cyclo-ligase [Nitrospinota bacterium]